MMLRNLNRSQAFSLWRMIDKYLIRNDDSPQILTPSTTEHLGRNYSYSFSAPANTSLATDKSLIRLHYSGKLLVIVGKVSFLTKSTLNPGMSSSYHQLVCSHTQSQSTQIVHQISPWSPSHDVKQVILIQMGLI